MPITNQVVLDKSDAVELTLELLSFAGGENTISEDQAMKTEAARVLENWASTSLGGMQRETGFSLSCDGSPTYSGALDLLIEHKDASGGPILYGIIAGDLVKKDSSDIVQEDAAAFTSGVLSHGVSVKDSAYVWITNTSDGLKRKGTGGAIAAPASVPPTHCARVYNHKNRLIAEGSVSAFNRIYGSRTGMGNWTAADAWSLANDAWSIDLPEATAGCVPNFPSGNEVLAFTSRNAYSISNFPNTAYRPLSTPGRGCAAPYSIALGDEGVYFVSRYPTLGVFLFDGTTFTELSEFNRDVFVEKIDFSKRIFGMYRNRRYYLFYNEANSGVAYPNRLRIYDARYGRWMNRPVATGLADNFGYPALLQYTANELVIGSSRAANIYAYDDTTTSDAGASTAATYTTKTFSSRDFAISSGGQFPIDDVKLKLIKLTVTYFGTTGSLGLQWTADRGLHSGSKVVSLAANGDMLNTSFIVNTSFILSSPPDKTITRTFSNNAVGKRFQFSLTNSGTSTIPKIKKLKIHAIAINES